MVGEGRDGWEERRARELLLMVHLLMLLRGVALPAG